MNMTYSETIDYLYNATPQFQRVGAAAYKPGLGNAVALDDAFGNLHRRYPTIHVAGTNGKGSTCHTLAAILQAQGYNVGLFTSPHLVDFRERIRINGETIAEDEVTGFVERYLEANVGIEPSFFELTTIMAFDHFARHNVDVAVIETGLGGRLDTTNIITPVLSVITNISFDHKAQLGDTLAAIAAEKAGIMKPGVPVVIGNAKPEEVSSVFLAKASEVGAPVFLAQERERFGSVSIYPDRIEYGGSVIGDFTGQLSGDCQPENAATVLCAVERLREAGFSISDSAARYGFANVVESTGLLGRWMRVGDTPTVICDTGHNEGGWRYLGPRLAKLVNSGLRMVIGFVNDKEVDAILRMMPSDAVYYFAQASVPRAMDSAVLSGKAAEAGLKGKRFGSVAEALDAAKRDSAPSDTIFVGGSTFVVADLIALMK